MITVITNGRLLDCVGDEPQEDGSIIIENGIIKDVHQGKKPLPSDAAIIDVCGKTVLPGLTDAHVHPSFTENPRFVRRGDSPPLYAALSTRTFLEQALEGGFTTMRGAAWTHWSIKQAVEEELIKGPRLLIACAPLTSTGGHFDRSIYGETLFHSDRERLYKFPRICDGPNECIKAVREQFRNGADHIKFDITGGIDDPSAEMGGLSFNRTEIRAIVKEAEARGSYVLTHSENDTGSRMAVECGVRTIEHGPFLSEKTAALMKERGAYLVPTNVLFWHFIQRSKEKGVSKTLTKNVLEPFGKGQGSVLDGQMRAVEIAHRAGVSIGSGTDMGPFLPYQLGMEFKLKTECGMTPYEAIKSGTVVNAEIFHMEDKIGSLEPGKWADMIAVSGNPDQDIELLSNPVNVNLVIKKGKIFKNTLRV